MRFFELASTKRSVFGVGAPKTKTRERRPHEAKPSKAWNRFPCIAEPVPVGSDWNIYEREKFC